MNIHPFIAGNGRMARLLMNLILLGAGFPVVIIPPIFRVQNIETTKAGNRAPPFLGLLEQVVEQSLRDYLKLIEKMSP